MTNLCKIMQDYWHALETVFISYLRSAFLCILMMLESLVSVEKSFFSHFSARHSPTEMIRCWWWWCRLNFSLSFHLPTALIILLWTRQDQEKSDFRHVRAAQWRNRREKKTFHHSNFFLPSEFSVGFRWYDDMNTATTIYNIVCCWWISRWLLSLNNWTFPISHSQKFAWNFHFS